MAATVLQRRERAISQRRLEAIAIREELDLATERQVRLLVHLECKVIAARMGVSQETAKRLQRAARRRIMRRWLEEEDDDGSQ